MGGQLLCRGIRLSAAWASATCHCSMRSTTRPSMTINRLSRVQRKELVDEGADAVGVGLVGGRKLNRGDGLADEVDGGDSERVANVAVTDMEVPSIEVAVEGTRANVPGSPVAKARLTGSTAAVSGSPARLSAR